MTTPDPDAHPLAVGDLVFDATAPWDDLRSGQVIEHEGVLSVRLPAQTKEELKQPARVLPLDAYPGKLQRHELMDAVWKGGSQTRARRSD